jgi:hypothetical protein
MFKYDSTVADPADILVFASSEEINWDNSGAEKMYIPKGSKYRTENFWSHPGEKAIRSFLWTVPIVSR